MSCAPWLVCCRGEDRLEALRLAIGHAATATATASDNNEANPVSLLPLPPFGKSRNGDNNSNNQDESTTDGREEEEVDDVVEGLEQRALRLEHFMTAEARVGSNMAERLSPFLLSGCVCVVNVEGADPPPRGVH